jgi:ABC-type glycerol-3-phosphate transport system substrate-binding protein
MTMKKLLILLLVVAPLLAACGPKEEATPAPTDVATSPPVPSEETVESVPTPLVEKITIRFAVDDLEQALYQDTIRAFEEDNPDIDIKLVSINETLDLGAVGGEWPEDAMLRLAEAADVINVQTSRGAVDAGLVLDLMPLIETHPNAHPEDFFPGTLSACQWDGGTWCLPTAANFQLIFFDKDAFDQVGEPYPEPGWTWDDLLAKASALTEEEGGEVTRWGFVQSWNRHVNFIDSWVGPLVDSTADPPEPLFDRPEVLEAVTWYTDLYLDHRVMPYYKNPEDTSGLTVPEGQKLIDGEQAAMWPNFSGLWSWLSEQRNLGVAPFPVEAPGTGGKGDRTTPLSISAAFVSAGTAHPEEAWRWLNNLSLQTVDLMGLQFLPARRSVAEASGFWEDADEELGAALRFAVEHAYVMDWQPGYDALSDAIDDILSGEKSVEGALADAQIQAGIDISEELAEGEEATPAPTVIVVSGEEGEVSPEAITIVFTPGPSGILSLGPFRDLADKFRETHPEIVVDVQQPNIYGGASAMNLKSLAEDADCFGWAPQFQDPENLGAILSLEPFLDADPSFSTDDFYPLMLNRFTYQGQLWGLPSEGTTYVIEYNKDLFDAAGVDYPALDPTDLDDIWTTDDFLAIAVALTTGEDEEKVYGLVTNYYEVNDLVFLMERLGAVLVDQSVDPPTIDFSDPSVVEALRWYADLSTEYGVKPIYIGDIADILTSPTLAVEREALINDGKAGMWTAAGAVSVLGEREGLNVGVAPLPVGTTSTGGAYVSAEGYFISAGTEARQACWQWITFLTGEPEAVQNIPARRSVAESAAFRGQVGDERAATYLATMAATDKPSSLQFLEDEPWMGVGLIWLGRAYAQTVDDELPVEEALNQVQDTFDAYRACVISRDAMSDEQEYQACVMETDPSFPAFIFGG